jgi:homoserine O-acetyltransferase/O-succinyltransferase
MKNVLTAVIAAAAVALCQAADIPAAQEGVYVARDFRFHTGEVLPEVKLGYRTLGTPGRDTVVVFHGTGGSSASMLSPGFAGQLFGPGQPLDAGKYFIVIPDAIGHGKSSKPSDGLKTKFPKYDYDDMVEGHHRLLTEHFKLPRVRMVIGNSMGGMEAWIYATRHPDFMDIAVPMACMPTEMGSRNWMMRRLIVDSIRNDPDWKNGEYTVQPKSPRFATVFYQVATNGGNHGWYKAAPTRAKADEVLNARLAANFTADANDVLYQWESSGDYNPSPNLEKIRATVLSINAAADERNPVELGLLEREVKRVRNGRLMIIPSGPGTTGHGTTGSAKWYAREIAELMASAPRLGP